METIPLRSINLIIHSTKGTFSNDVPCFLAIFDLPTHLVLLCNVPFLGLSWTPLPTLIWDVINERSQIGKLGPAGSKRKTTTTVFVQCQFVLWLDCSFCFCSNALGDNGVKAASRILRSKRARVVEITHTAFHSNVSITP